MATATLLARRFDTAQGVRLTLDNNCVTRAEPCDDAPQDRWLAPALFDPQINGFADLDFQADGLKQDDLLRVVRALRAAGCGQFLLTLITADFETLLARLRTLRKLRETHRELKSAIAGWHLEGPFLSSSPGYCGAHDAALMRDPTPAHMQRIRDAAPNEPILLTLSPERAGAVEAIQAAVNLKFRVSLGHTDASAEILAQAVEAGATGFTHLGNGCPQTLDRHDNILVRALDTPGLHVTLIPDRLHVPPPLFSVFHKALGRERVAYTTDAMAAAGAPPGRYTIGRIELEVGPDRVVRMPGKTNFAGSALRPLDGVLNAAAMLGCSWRETWASASVQARRYAGVSLYQAGAPYCILTTEGETLKAGQLYADGEKHELVF